MSTSSLKKVNLDQLQRPKTLIVIHYRGKRVSIPLFEPYENITEYLCHQLYKFEATVLDNEHHKPKDSRHSHKINQIVCFTAREQDNNKLDLKMNILLSMSRLPHDQGRVRLDLHVLDITAYYKFMEIEPYYGSHSKELIPEYQLFSVLTYNSQSTTYLGRKISDGRFFSIKFWRGDNKYGQKEYSCLKILHDDQARMINKDQLQLIPGVEEIRKADGYLIFILEYCPGGTLREYLSSRLSELECLHYMKQLIWGVHTLHQKYNFIHRALCFENLYVDFVGNLRLMGFQNCQPCYSSNYLTSSQVPQSYEENYVIDNVITPPEVSRSMRYNNLVDYYGIGVVLYELFHGRRPDSERMREKSERQGIEVAIDSLMSDNLKNREMFAQQVITELHNEKMKKFENSERSCLQNERLTLNKIQTGIRINIEEHMANGIPHQQVIKIMKPSHDDQIYYLNPVKGAKKSRSKGKSKDKSKSKEKTYPKEKSVISEGKKSSKSSKKAISVKSSSNEKQKSKEKSLTKESKNTTLKSKKESSKSKEKTPKPKLEQTGVRSSISAVMSTKTLKSPPKSMLMARPPGDRPKSKAKAK